MDPTTLMSVVTTTQTWHLPWLFQTIDKDKKKNMFQGTTLEEINMQVETTPLPHWGSLRLKVLGVHTDYCLHSTSGTMVGVWGWAAIAGYKSPTCVVASN